MLIEYVQGTSSQHLFWCLCGGPPRLVEYLNLLNHHIDIMKMHVWCFPKKITYVPSIMLTINQEWLTFSKGRGPNPFKHFFF